jgi:hypothetical protein
MPVILKLRPALRWAFDPGDGAVTAPDEHDDGRYEIRGSPPPCDHTPFYDESS